MFCAISAQVSTHAQKLLKTLAFFANLTLENIFKPTACIIVYAKKYLQFFFLQNIFFYFFAQIRRIRRRMRRICANIFLRNCANCAKIRADLQLCASKNHYIAPRIRAFRRLGISTMWGYYLDFNSLQSVFQKGVPL